MLPIQFLATRYLLQCFFLMASSVKQMLASVCQRRRHHACIDTLLHSLPRIYAAAGKARPTAHARMQVSRSFCNSCLFGPAVDRYTRQRCKPHVTDSLAMRNPINISNRNPLPTPPPHTCPRPLHRLNAQAMQVAFMTNLHSQTWLHARTHAQMFAP